MRLLVGIPFQDYLLIDFLDAHEILQKLKIKIADVLGCER